LTVLVYLYRPNLQKFGAALTSDTVESQLRFGETAFSEIFGLPKSLATTKISHKSGRNKNTRKAYRDTTENVNTKLKKLKM